MAKLAIGTSLSNVVPALFNTVEHNINSLSITPSISPQTFTPSGNVDGYGPVTVSAVTSSIDNNIQAGNIKSGVSILGVTGNVVQLNGTTTTINPSTSSQTITPTSPNNGFTSVTVPAVTSAIDSNIQAGNIKNGVTILGTTGTYAPSAGPDCYVDYIANSQGKLVRGNTIIDVAASNATDLSNYILKEAYKDNTNTTSTVDFSTLTAATGMGSCQDTFNGCTGITTVDLGNLITISGDYTFSGAFKGCKNISSLDLSSLTTVSGSSSCYQMFHCESSYNTAYTGALDLSNLTTVSGSLGCSSMFTGWAGITSVDLSSLTTISGTGGCSTMFRKCTNLASVNLSSLKELIGNSGGECQGMFGYDTSLTSVTFTALDTIPGSQACYQMFYSCTGLTSVSFPALKTTSFGSNTNQFQAMLALCSGVTLHFPSNLQSTISGLTGYSSGFSGTNTTILFDLPATS